jgi:hypothetical protein
VDSGGLFSSVKVVPLEQVATIGNGVVIITDKDAVVPADQHPEVRESLATKVKLIGKNVFTETGIGQGPEMGHNVSPAILRYWQENGGLALFAYPYPITEERIEKNPIDGKEYTVQYFERNRFELHPEETGTPPSP